MTWAGLSQMARDASGKPATEASGDGRSDSAKATSSSARVTRTIKGNKEVVIVIPELAGKGYPAPVDLDDGGPPKGTAARPGSRRRR